MITQQMQGWQILVFILMWLAIAINGCTPHELSSQSARTLSLVTPVEPATFNYANNGWYPSVFVFSHDGLTRQNGVTGEIEPALAESWQFSPDNKQVIFTLRKDLKWSDGHPLTADDVVFTYKEIIFNPKVPIAAKDLLRIGEKREFPKVRKLDKRRIEFVLPEPFSPFLQTTTGAQTNAVAIMPSHALEKTLRETDSNGNLKFMTTWGTDTDPKKVVVNGAYQLETYTTGQHLILKRNPYYWRKDHNGHLLPKVDRIIWHILENQDLQLLRFRSGDFDVLGDSRPIKPEYYALLKQTENRGNFQLLNGGAWSSVLQFFFNLNTGRDEQGRPFVDPVRSRWFNLKAFRQAIAYGIDQQRINTNIFRGLGIFYHSAIPQQSPFYLSPAQGLKVYPYNPLKAKELLLGAGFKYDNQGQLFDEQGNRVEFTLMTNVDNVARVAIGSQIQQDLAKIGINVNLQPINFSLLGKNLSSRRWEACMIGFESGSEPHLLAPVWMSNGAAHLFNMSQHSLEPPIEGYTKKPFEVVIDQLFQRGAQEFDLAMRKKIYDQFQQIAQEELPILYLVNDRALMAARNDVQGLKYSGLASWGLWNIDELKLVGRIR